jgi:hypothetical protein
MKKATHSRKKNVAQRRAQPVVTAVATDSQFWVIDPECPGEHAGSQTATGPFSTVAEAEAYLVRDAVETFSGCDERICDALARQRRDWARPVHIVQLVRSVQQVPTVRIGCDILPANAAGQPRDTKS